MAFMEPRTYHGAYYHVDTLLECFIVPADHVGSSATAEELAKYAPEYVSRTALDQIDEWEIEIRQGWYGRLSADGYLDCTEWEYADTEEELLESLQGDDDQDDEESDDEPDSIGSDHSPAELEAMGILSDEPALAESWRDAIEPDDVPNLDAMTDTADVNDALIAIRSNESLPRDVREILAAYCDVKIDAMRHRLAGRIQEALTLEAECDRLYRALPERYRW